MLEGIKKVHMIGIGGIGMSAIAKLLIEKDKVVSGSDLQSSDITRDLKRRGASVHEGHSPSNVPDDTELVIYSSAVPEDNLERVRAVELGVKQLSYAEYLGELSKEYSTIVVTGTHGKSTTTAMLGLMLEAAGYDPTVIVGSLVPGFKLGNLRIGKGRFLVLEGCEHKANILHLEPEMIVLTNIEEDHLDFYRDIDHIRETFQEFVDKLKGKGLTIINGDDPESMKLDVSRRVTFGTRSEADYRGHGRDIKEGVQKVTLDQAGQKIGDLTLKIPGVFNLMNGLAAISAAMELGAPFEVCQKVLEDFSGIWRRFEKVGTWQGADVISDYGHHPTEIAATVAAARELYPGRRIVLCFQPHQHSRIKKMFDDFVEVLAHSADHIVLPEIYEVAGRAEDTSISSRDLIEAVHKMDPGQDIVYAKDLEEAEFKLRDIVKANDVVIIQGAGDVDDLARRLV